jgi:hypothetical protein
MSTNHTSLKIDANRKLKEIGDQLLNWYVRYFGDLVTTFEEDQAQRRKRDSLIAQFVNSCFELIQEDVFKSVYFKFNIFFQKNSSDEHLRSSVETAFHNAILEVTNKIFLQALLILYKKEELNEEEIVLTVNNTFQNFLYNYKPISEEDFLSKTILKIKKNLLDENTINEQFTNNFKGLIFTIVNSRIIELQRKIAIDFKRNTPMEEAGMLSDNSRGPEELISSAEYENEKWQIFYQLRREEQIFMLLRYRYQSSDGKTGMPFTDIAQIYDSTVNTMKVKRNRILKKLSQPLNSKGEGELEFDYASFQNLLSEQEDLLLKRIIILEENQKAKTAFEISFKNIKSYWLMLRWMWLFDPTIFIISDIYDIDENDKVETIAGFYKSTLWDTLKNEKIIQ